MWTVTALVLVNVTTKTFNSKHVLKSLCTLVVTGPSACYCTKIYKPVCGVDGKEYTNWCRAECKGVSVRCEGKCPCKRKYKNIKL